MAKKSKDKSETALTSIDPRQPTRRGPRKKQTIIPEAQALLDEAGAKLAAAKRIQKAGALVGRFAKAIEKSGLGADFVITKLAAHFAPAQAEPVAFVAEEQASGEANAAE